MEFIYGQMLVILTKLVNRCFEKNPKLDMTTLLDEDTASSECEKPEKIEISKDEMAKLPVRLLDEALCAKLREKYGLGTYFGFC